jgi:hypothetical protein
MSTPIYKVSDGSVITFGTRGPLRYATLTRPNGEVIKGREWMSSTIDYPGIAEEILLANNVVDNNAGGAPLPYTIEEPPTPFIDNNLVYEIPRIVLAPEPDVTSVQTAKVNKEISSENNKALETSLESELSTQDKIVKSIKEKKSEIRKTLIPFIITLLAAFGAQALQAVIAKLPIDQIKDLIDCPSSSKINELIKKRNSLVTQINNIYGIVKTLTTILGITNTVISAIQIGIQIAKANPYPATGIPPLGLPPLTSGAQTSIASFVAALETQLKSLGKTLNVITITVGSFGILLGIILKLLEALDMLLQECAENNAMSLTAINNEINALANPTIEATQNGANNTNGSSVNIYKGFTLGVKIDETNTSSYIKRYAVAQNKQGIPVLRTDSSFASDPAILISQLKFIIDSDPNIIAE